jgi:hypothetical protein
VAKDFEDYMFEDECCLNCGEIDYTPSKTPGICSDCLSSNGSIEEDSIEREED